MMATEYFWSPVLLSLQVASLSLVIVVIVGVMIGRTMAHRSFRGKAVVDTFFLLPLVLPPSVIWFFINCDFRKKFIGGSVDRMVVSTAHYFYMVGSGDCCYRCFFSVDVSISKNRF